MKYEPKKETAAIKSDGKRIGETPVKQKPKRETRDDSKRSK